MSSSRRKEKKEENATSGVIIKGSKSERKERHVWFLFFKTVLENSF